MDILFRDTVKNIILTIFFMLVAIVALVMLYLIWKQVFTFLNSCVGRLRSVWNNQVFSRKYIKKRKAVLVTVAFLTAVLTGILSIEARHADTKFLLPDTTSAEIMSNRRTQADPDAPACEKSTGFRGL